jgi:hypothetical protein
MLIQAAATESFKVNIVVEMRNLAHMSYISKVIRIWIFYHL